jgi:hypothetical protein
MQSRFTKQVAERPQARSFIPLHFSHNASLELPVASKQEAGQRWLWAQLQILQVKH